MRLNVKRGFTLIELLVVIAIIAILAAILFPVFAQAKTAAKKSADLSNMKQIGLASMMYNDSNDDTYAQAYWYKNDTGDVGGYWHWSASFMPYMKSAELFVSPGDSNRGLVPTNPPCKSISETGVASPGCDSQVPRISYTVNAALMPRKRRSIDPANVVGYSMVDAPAETILVAPFTHTPACVNDTSNQTSTGFKNKSHRSVNAVMNKNGSKWKGEAVEEYMPNVTSVYAVSEAKAREAFTGCKSKPGPDYVQVAYIQPDRFGDGSNYSFGDGHAKFFNFFQTIKPSRYMWGKSMYSAGGMPILDQNGQPIQ
jgi:prepilin-type N-terminal cleavage/methylation domain-containing protein/prepilin-type processing-associated H-X9-DG protein